MSAHPVITSAYDNGCVMLVSMVLEDGLRALLRWMRVFVALSPFDKRFVGVFEVGDEAHGENFAQRDTPWAERVESRPGSPSAASAERRPSHMTSRTCRHPGSQANNTGDAAARVVTLSFRVTTDSRDNHVPEGPIPNIRATFSATVPGAPGGETGFTS